MSLNLLQPCLRTNQIQRRLMTAFLLCEASFAGSRLTAQHFVPLGAESLTNQIHISWPTIPGKTYDLFWSDQPQALPTSTNSRALRARSTIGTFTDSTVDTNVTARFYGVKDRATLPANTGAITATSVIELEKVLGLTFSDRTQLPSALSGDRSGYEAMRAVRLLNSDPPALVFNPRPIGFTLETVQNPITWSPPKVVLLPTNQADLAFYSVRDLGEMIRTRQISSTALTQFYLGRLKKYDPTLHCVITLTEDLALQQAARADQELAAGNYRGPLHGIPYGIKDLFSVRGYRTTWGAAPFKDQVIDQDATVATKLEQAGAVLVAKLSTGELAVDDVWFGGQTRNPWNPSQGSSGSSAGPASATSAGLVAFGIGTETFGSIWSPCTVCRVTGLRSTFGRVSRSGAMTLSWSMDKVGPICRNVEDCAIVFDAIRGADGLDQAAIDAPFNYDPTLDLKQLRVGYRRGDVPSAALSRLAGLVGQLVTITLPTTPAHAWTIIDAESATVFDELTRFGADTFLVENVWPNEFRNGQTIPAVEYLQANRHRQKLIQQMGELMKTVDVFVVGNDNDASALELTNLTGQPCAVIPHGSGTSLSFIGKLYDEATILALAKAYQDITPYHTNHPPAFIH
jgi:Asp-tRNA(Asn)/Glu-tRNA(Gln) amidotransferase A subunit family amidase